MAEQQKFREKWTESPKNNSNKTEGGGTEVTTTIKRNVCTTSNTASNASQSLQEKQKELLHHVTETSRMFIRNLQSAKQDANDPLDALEWLMTLDYDQNKILSVSMETSIVDTTGKIYRYNYRYKINPYNITNLFSLFLPICC